MGDLAAAHDTLNSVVFYEFPGDEDVAGEDYDVPGRITLDWIKRSLPIAEADFYFCGPKGFMRMLALGLRARRPRPRSTSSSSARHRTCTRERMEGPPGRAFRDCG